MRAARLTMLTATMAAALIAGTSQASATTQGTSTTQAATANYYPFRYGRMVATYVVRELNNEASFSDVRASSVSTYQIVLRGHYDGIPFKAHLHKIGTQRIFIELWVLGMYQHDTMSVGFNC